MRIEYVIIESRGKKHIKPSKGRIRTLIKKSFNMSDNNTVCINGKRKVFELYCDISCQSATDEITDDNIYNLIIVSQHNDKKRQIELIEEFNKEFQRIVDADREYHLILAYDEVSEYYCNKVFPKYQKFERQLRHLVFKVLTKSYGSFWAKKTISSQDKEKVRKSLRSSEGSAKEDQLIEKALYEMTLGQLIEYLFYSIEQSGFENYLDNNYPQKIINELTKSELIDLLKKAQRRSVWNMFLADVIDISEPITKMSYLAKNRNKVAHCKFFYKDDYKTTSEYLNQFIPKIESAIENVAIENDEIITDVLVGFNNFANNIVNAFSSALVPALSNITKLFSPLSQILLSQTRDVANQLGQTVNSFSQIYFENMKTALQGSALYNPYEKESEAKLLSEKAETELTIEKKTSQKDLDKKTEESDNGKEKS